MKCLQPFSFFFFFFFFFFLGGGGPVAQHIWLRIMGKVLNPELNLFFCVCGVGGRMKC